MSKTEQAQGRYGEPWREGKEPGTIVTDSCEAIGWNPNTPDTEYRVQHREAYGGYCVAESVDPIIVKRIIAMGNACAGVDNPGSILDVIAELRLHVDALEQIEAGLTPGRKLTQWEQERLEYSRKALYGLTEPKL